MDTAAVLLAAVRVHPTCLGSALDSLCQALRGHGDARGARPEALPALVTLASDLMHLALISATPQQQLPQQALLNACVAALEAGVLGAADMPAGKAVQLVQSAKQVVLRALQAGMPPDQALVAVYDAMDRLTSSLKQATDADRLACLQACTSVSSPLLKASVQRRALEEA